MRHIELCFGCICQASYASFHLGLTSQVVRSMAALQLPGILTFVTARHVRLSLWVPEVPSVLPHDPEDMNEEISDRTDTESNRDRLLHVECHRKHQFQKPFPSWATYRFQQARHRLIFTGHSFSPTNLARLGAVSRAWLRATLLLTSDSTRPKVNVIQIQHLIDASLRHRLVFIFVKDTEDTLLGHFNISLYPLLVLTELGLDHEKKVAVFQDA